MNVAQRLQRLEAALDYLRSACEGAHVIVEGQKDVAALGALGVGGDHGIINRPGTMADLVDELAADERPVVVLADWDRTGGRLARRLHEGLMGRTPVDLESRRRLAAACHCRCVEHVPGELEGLRAQVGRPR